MRLLFLTTQLPFPPKSGGLIKSWRLLAHWSKNFDVGLIHPLKAGDKQNLLEFEKQGLSLKEHFHRPVHVERSASNLVRSYLGYSTLNVLRNYSKEIETKVSESIDGYDVLFIDHYEMGQYIPKNSQIPVVLHEHNAEYVMWERLAEIEKNPLKRLVINMEAKRIQKAEKTYADLSEQVWAAPNDQIELTKLGIGKDKMVTTYHLGEDDMLESEALDFKMTERRILFIGTLTWEANIDGLLWFMDKAWPHIETDSSIQLDIVGKNPDPRLIEFASGLDRIHFHGFVDDLEPLYKRSRVFIVPLRFGSGIKVKLLNAMYRGIPTVTTEIGTEGLDVEDGLEIFQTAEPEIYAAKIMTLMDDESTWATMSTASREKARKYSWSTLLAEHDKSLTSIRTQNLGKPKRVIPV